MLAFWTSETFPKLHRKVLCFMKYMRNSCGNKLLRWGIIFLNNHIFGKKRLNRIINLSFLLEPSNIFFFIIIIIIVIILNLHCLKFDLNCSCRKVPRLVEGKVESNYLVDQTTILNKIFRIK